ncbi:MAG: sigma 54-interacting transcriptional regulator [Smithellaceae bacterium]
METSQPPETSVRKKLGHRLSPHEKHQQTYEQWERFTQGHNDIDTNMVPSDILEAWRRCRDRKLDPLSKPQPDVARGEALETLLEENRYLIETSRPFLDKLYEFVRPSGFTVGLFNHQGYILSVRQEAQYEKFNTKFNWLPGTLWNEATAGNHSVSMTLHLKKPIQLFGTQHYKKRFHAITASSAPILSPDGTVIGGITLTAFYIGTNPHTLGVAVAAAQAIENELRLQKALTDCRAAFDRTEIAASLQRAVISAIPEALITINVQQQIFVINEQAKKMFGLTGETAEGRFLTGIFPGEENSAFMDFILNHETFDDVELRIKSLKGSADYSVTGSAIRSSSGSLLGKILVFAGSKRIKKLVTRIIGAKANFRFKDICSRNPQFQKAVEQAFHISQSASNVLLLGESGTGKDVFAQSIHNASARKSGPYVAINCAAIPRDLMASELFGYSEGAFTGSRRGGNPGKFELADGGTIFLDEIAEIPLEIQAVLLRVLEDKQVVRVGSGRIRTVDARIISATNRDLMEEVRKGGFRNDLYYRLNVFNIQLLPLRERPDDIPVLVETFIAKYAAALGKNIARIDAKAMDILMQHTWPGNVRELQNVIERMVNYAPEDELSADLIPPEIIHSGHQRRRTMDLESPEDQEQKIIRHMLALKFKKNQIAERLNISRTTLFRKMRKYGLTEIA